MIPTSTYRLQLHAAQTFDAAADLADYLAALGVGALYASPMLEATPGSDHGYDVVDPTRASTDRGGEAGRLRMVAALRAAQLGLLIDIVPNHVGISVPTANPWWSDVLVNGRSSRYAGHFDVDWESGPILVPILGGGVDDEATELERLEIVRDDSGNPGLRYYEHLLPVAHGSADSGTALEVHDRQHYRLVSWRRGSTELNYRRFFDVSTLAAIRVEDEGVFADAHRELLRWLDADPDVHLGLRVDHPDGLADPGGYLRRLRAALGPDRWLLVEKILGVGEELPASWPVDGSVGYEALREVCGVFVDPDGAGLLTQLAAEHTGQRLAAHTVERSCRRLVADTILVAEVRRIAGLIPGVDPEKARDAVAELLSSFPVYRSYLPEQRHALEVAVSVAATNRPELADIVAGIHAAMLADPGGELATRVQQTSGMVTAKGVEDTAFYRWNRLVALNEVGGDPARFGASVAEFHAGAARREASRPAGMTLLSTHDTKRSEDVRARLAVLSELPAEWGHELRRWSAAHPLPERSLELLAWQTVVGAWPIDAERLAGYLGKAAKEAKLATSHVDPVTEVDDAIARWPHEVLASPVAAEIEAFVARIAYPGWSNSLGQKLLQLAGPGVPDVYQGTELFEYSLVDPDNRRPVDFPARRELLARLDDGPLPPVDASGAAKLLVTASALRLRRYRPELFTGYRALAADGPTAEHAVAFSRGRGAMVAVATRLPAGLAARGGWGDTVLALPDGADDWVDVITGSSVDGAAPRLADLLARYPVALLVRPA